MPKGVLGSRDNWQRNDWFIIEVSTAFAWAFPKGRITWHSCWCWWISLGQRRSWGIQIEFLVGSFLPKVCFIDRNAIIHQCSYPFSSGSMDGRSLTGIYRSPSSGIVRHNMLEELQFLLNQMQAFPVERSLLDIISRILGWTLIRWPWGLWWDRRRMLGAH